MTEQTEAQRLAHILTTQSTLSEYQQDEAAAELLRLDAVEQAYNMLLEKTYAQPAPVPDLTHDQWDQWQDKHSLLLGRDALDDLRSMLAVQPAHVLLSEKQKQELAENWFSEDWCITKAIGMMYDYDKLLLGSTKLENTSKPAPVQNPVAWNKRIRDSVDALLEQAGYQPDSSARHQLGMMNFDAQPAAQRKPLTDAQIHAIDTSEFWFEHTALDFARAIEAAHGITEVKQ